MSTLITQLGNLVKERTDKGGRSLVLMWDHEDGFFISTIDSGTRHFPVLDMDTGSTHATIAEAIKAAVEYHNKEVAELKQQDRCWMKEIKT